MEDELPKEFILREGEEVILRVDCEKAGITSSIEDSGLTMSYILDLIIENKDITKIILYEKRDYEYDSQQVNLLLEIAKIFVSIVKDKNLLSYYSMGEHDQVYAEIKKLLFQTLKTDPIGAYVELNRILRREEISKDSSNNPQLIKTIENYIYLLQHSIKYLEESRLITISKAYLAGYNVGDREVYRRIFRPMIKPDFMFTKIMASYPEDGEELDNYLIHDDIEVTIFRTPDSTQYIYHIMPPEFKLEEDKYEILDNARKIMSEHKPKEEEFVNPQRMRKVFYDVGRDLIEELASYQKLNLLQKEVDKLTNILVRYTVGFGLIEVLLQDEKIQDISVNSPLGKIPIFIVHSDFDDCKTNIIPTKPEADSWASKLRMISGRPLDEANPILDTELELPEVSTRVSLITEPLNPSGLAFSFRRHRDKPWTLPLFIKYKMVSPIGAGLISFLVDGTRTMLIAGTRSSGKSSFLTSILVEIMRRYRIITIEDTLELPTKQLRELGFNIQPMKVASALQKGSSEMSAEDGIRATLRLGDSSLIVGEVRSGEAKALYEAMRVGAAANVVAGTIHGDTPYGIFDRVVNDIGVPKTSFKATDIIIIANPIKSADGLHKFRRVTQITEVRKNWEDDPSLEGGFVDLMKYNPTTDLLEPTEELLNGDSEILKSIAGNVKDYVGNWDAVWENILLRAKIKEKIAKTAINLNDDDMLEAPFVIKCNDAFHNISEKVSSEKNELDYDLIYEEWEKWFNKELSKRELLKRKNQF
ncbi:MAG: ATPase, T2SS/T4P/T4SS family [Candidatus Woesearchaeota archaeon]